MRYDNVTFVSDYGTGDECVGTCKSVIRTIAAHANVIDLTHDIAPFDVRGASLVLVRAARYLCPGVVLAVVDPESGGDRRAVAVELGGGESVLVGPDNGLLAPLASVSGGATRAFELDATYRSTTQSAVSAGRDLFAPVVGHLCNGVQLHRVGTEIDAATLVPSLVPFSNDADGVLRADVIAIDRFGNVQLNVAPAQLADYGRAIEVIRGDRVVSARRVESYSEADKRPGLIVDRSELLSLVVDRDSAAARFAIEVGDVVMLRPDRMAVDPS